MTQSAPNEPAEKCPKNSKNLGEGGEHVGPGLENTLIEAA